MEKLNIAELLKDCPKGMELDCVMYDGLEFDRVDERSNPYYSIVCRVKTESGQYNFHTFTKYGSYSRESYSKCVIFPKGKTTWEGFQRPFKDGDVLIKDNNTLCIYKSIHKTYKNKSFIDFYCGYRPSDNQFVIKDTYDMHFGLISEAKLATEEEKQKFFDAIKANGYKWNEENKTLEKLIVPKFKVGDRIRHKTTNKNDIYEISKVYDDSYGLVGFTWMVYMKYQNDYELVPNKFDITTLIPFESKVLVRSSMDGLWKPAVFGFRNGYNDNAFYIVGGSCWKQCIPYLNNEHLCGTTNDCDDFYKTWE